MTDYPEALDLETVAIAAVAPALAGDVGNAEWTAGKLRRGWKKGDRAVRITRTGGTPVDWVGHLQRARLQIEAFAEDDETAFRLAARAVVELRRLEGQTLGVAVVTAVNTDLDPRRQPDPPTDAPRYVAGVILFAHPGAS